MTPCGRLYIPVRQAMKERRKVLVAIDDTSLENLLQTFHQLPRKGRSLREVIDYLYDELHQTFRKGYSYEEVIEMLGQRGISIAEPTLRQYMSEARKARQLSHAPTQPKTKTVTARSPLNPERSQVEAIPEPQSTGPPPISLPPATRESRRHIVGNFVPMPNEL